MFIDENSYNSYMARISYDRGAFRDVSEEIAKEHEKYFQKINKKAEVKDDVVKKSNNKVDVSRCVTMMDYVQEYAKTSNDYKNFLELVNTYEDIGLTEVYNAVTGLGSITVNSFKDGDFKCSTRQVIDAFPILNYERKFADVVINGRRDYFNIAIAFCFNLDGVDKDRLFTKIRNKSGKMDTIKSINQAIELIEKFYNNKLPADEKIFFKQEYIKYKALKSA